MDKTTRKQLMNLFMRQVWNEGNFSTQSFDPFGFLKQMGVF